MTERNAKTRDLLLSHYRRYPCLELADIFKFAYQSAFGCEHLVTSETAAAEYIRRELAVAPPSPAIPEPLDGDYFRLPLACLGEALSPERLAHLFCLSAKREEQGASELSRILSVAHDMVRGGALPFSEDAFSQALSEWREAGFPAVHHSERFRAAYHPAYRVIANQYLGEIAMTIADKEHFASDYGCDFVLRLGSERAGGEIRLLQLTDMQVIDASQRRSPDRLRADEIAAWSPELFDRNAFDHIRSLVAQTSPDLIFITGDFVYGQFDDEGTVFERFCREMDSLEIPWAPVFGNHDNESKRGVAWQCEMLEKSRRCLFRRGSCTGNGNYSVGIEVGGELVRVLYMLDSNGCKGSTEPTVMREQGLYPDQLALVSETAERIRASAGRYVPAFLAMHIPVSAFAEAERAKGYRTEGRRGYTIGVDFPAKDGDFGSMCEEMRPIELGADFPDFLRRIGVDGVFAGHYHTANTCILYRDIRWVFGLKTGQYDYHTPYALGGTLVSLVGDSFSVRHIPALVPCAPFPGGSRIFNGMLIEP